MPAASSRSTNTAPNIRPFRLTPDPLLSVPELFAILAAASQPRYARLCERPLLRSCQACLQSLAGALPETRYADYYPEVSGETGAGGPSSALSYCPSPADSSSSIMNEAPSPIRTI